MKMKRLDPRIAVVPGSFDPMTMGHRDIIKRASVLYKKVIVGLLINPDKTYRFTQDERVKIAELTLSDISNAEIATDNGFLTDFCHKKGAKIILKGVRTTKDFVYEQEMADFNRARDPELETVYLPASPELTDISSTCARAILDAGGDLSGILHPDVCAWLSEKQKD